MNHPLVLDRYSFTAIPIEMNFQSTPLSKGTGFIWRGEDQSHYLVTNWHNLTGINPNTGEHLSKTGAEPDNVDIYLNLRGQLGTKFKAKIFLRDSEGKPIWLVHSTFGKLVDAVALPLPHSSQPDWFAMNGMSDDALAIEIGHDVYVLGFPFGMGRTGLPVWKRGSIASEPRLSLPEQLYILVDTASRPGMSGSPVIRRSWGNHSYENGSVSMGPGSATSFVGIYSGRLATSDPLDAQLGLVWPAALVAEIVNGGVVDS